MDDIDIWSDNDDTINELNQAIMKKNEIIEQLIKENNKLKKEKEYLIVENRKYDIILKKVFLYLRSKNVKKNNVETNRWSHSNTDIFNK